MAYPKNINEAPILAEMLWLLKLLKNHGKLDFVRMNISPVIRTNPRTGERYFTPNEAAGLADIFIWIKNGPFIQVETKKNGGKRGPKQVEWHERLTRISHYHYWVYTLMELQSILASHGCRL